MAKPSKNRRPRDSALLAFHVMQEAVGDAPKYDPSAEQADKDPAAVALGKRGGKARAAKMSPEERSEAARKAARARWGGTFEEG